MPLLTNPRHEAFAAARAQGAILEDAYEDAGYAPDRGHAARLAAQRRCDRGKVICVKGLDKGPLPENRP